MLTLILLGTLAFAEDKAGSSSVAAIVNGEEIKLDDVDRLFRQKPKSGPPMTASMVSALRRAAVDDLIDEVLIRQFLAKQKIKVDPKEVEEQIKVLAEALSRRGESYDKYLKESGTSDAQAREQFTTIIGFEKFVATTGSEEELKKFYSLHTDYFSNLKVRAEVHFVRVSKSALPDERKKAKATLKAGGGEPYFPDAKTFEIGWLTKFDSIVEDALAAEAFRLSPGQTSEPIDLEFGVCTIKCLERNEAKPMPFEKITDWVRDVYASQLRKVVVARMRREATIRITLP
ncbi:MAG: SurA N-terminal domain-containing protein [Gemmataceae bacterium]